MTIGHSSKVTSLAQWEEASQQVCVSHDLVVGPVQACQLCGAEALDLVIDLGFHPPCDSLIRQPQLDAMEKTYPLRFVRCRKCGLAQIDHVVEPSELFYPGYPYRSGITETLRRNLMGIAGVLAKSLNLEPGAFVVDLGSNDGTTLQGFKALGMRVLGVEPTDIAKIAIDNGVPTIQAFFAEALAREIRDQYGPASAITACNMFAHIPNLGDLIRGAATLLGENGIFLTESHYLVDLLETVQYDSIYHEHLKYYSLDTIQRLFADYDFTVMDAERIPNYGGSIRVFAKKGRGHQMSDRLMRLVDAEQAFLDDSTSAYATFRAKVLRSKLDLLAMLVDINRKGQRVVGIGCPGRSSTLLNYCGIGPDLLPYIAEQSSCLKLGMYLPGKHIPIVDERILFEEQPDYAVMLSWHYHQSIVAKLRERGFKSRIIVPLPEVQVIGV